MGEARALRCLSRFHTYGFLAGTGLAKSCELEVISQLVELRRSATAHARRDGLPGDEYLFYAEQNARVVKNAEAYYHRRMGWWPVLT